MLEKHIQKQILDYLSYRPGKFWRQNTGAFKGKYTSKRTGVTKSRFVQFSISGAADITGVKDGRRIEIEVKRPKKDQSPEQIAFQELIESQGGLYVLARSLEDVRKAGL